jgi:hypothetical protein
MLDSPARRISDPSDVTLASRFESWCRCRGVACHVDERADDGGRALELQVTPLRGDAADAIAIRGLDSECWVDVAGMERLARVVEAWMEPAPARRRVLVYPSGGERSLAARPARPQTPVRC